MTMLLVGLDGEMSDSELDQGAVLIQIGAAVSPTQRFCSLIGWAAGTYHSSEKAMAVHGITVEQIAAAPAASEVDTALVGWLTAQLLSAGQAADAKRVVPVGWNVGGFDMPFVKAFLPRSYAMLSRRVVDLNAFCFAYADARRTCAGSVPRWSGWKRLAQHYAAGALSIAGVPEAWHDAGYDAAAALAACEFLADPPR